MLFPYMLKHLTFFRWIEALLTPVRFPLSTDMVRTCLATVPLSLIGAILYFDWFPRVTYPGMSRVALGGRRGDC